MYAQTASHHFGTWHFGTDISSPGNFDTCMFRSCRRTGTWTFHLHGRFDTRTFRHGDILAQGIFVTMDRHGIFWHLNILTHGYFGTLKSNMDVLEQTFRHLCYCAEMSPCRNVHGAKKSLCWKVPMLKSPCTETPTETKCPCAGTPPGPKCARAEMSQWWNVCAEISLADMLGTEMVGNRSDKFGQKDCPF